MREWESSNLKICDALANPKCPLVVELILMRRHNSRMSPTFPSSPDPNPQLQIHTCHVDSQDLSIVLSKELGPFLNFSHERIGFTQKSTK